MSDDILTHPDVQALLREADSAKAMLDEIGTEDPENFRRALERVHADLGRLIHRLAPRSEPAPDEEITHVTRREDAFASVMVEEEPTDPGIGDLRPGRRSLLGGNAPRTAARKPKNPAPPPRRRHKGSKRSAGAAPAAGAPDAPTPPRKARMITSQGALDLREDGSIVQAPLKDQGERADWMQPLADLLTVLALPEDTEEPGELAAEACRVQWATLRLDADWRGMPMAIQAALLGLLASRARHVQDHLAVDVGPRLALERLAEYRQRAGLSKVEGLYPERSAQTGSWAEDARRWWDTLEQGLGT